MPLKTLKREFSGFFKGTLGNRHCKSRKIKRRFRTMLKEAVKGKEIHSMIKMLVELEKKAKIQAQRSTTK